MLVANASDTFVVIKKRKEFGQLDIGLILKVAGVGILVSAASQILSKSGRDEQGMMLIIAGIIVVFFILVGEMSDLFDKIKDVFEL